MKKVLWCFVALMAVLLLAMPVTAQPKGTLPLGDYPLSSHWNFDVNTIQFSFLQVGEGVQSGSAVVEPLVAVGSGLTFYYGNKDVAPEYDAVVAINIPTLFVKTDQDGNFSVMPAALIGLLDNQACFGVGYDLADLPNATQSRWKFLFSFGFHFGE